MEKNCVRDGNGNAINFDEWLKRMPDNLNYIKRYFIYDKKGNKEYWKNWDYRMRRDLGYTEMNGFRDLCEYVYNI